MRARPILFGACVVAFTACGGGGPAEPVSVDVAGAGTTRKLGIALEPPTGVGEGNRIGLTWRAQGGLMSFTVYVQRADGLGFEVADASVTGRSAQFARGPAHRWDFPTARVLVRGCTASDQCVDSNEQPLLDVLLAGVAEVTPAIQPLRVFGYRIALSADGNTMTAAANENDPARPGQGTLRVFQREPDGRWTQEALLDRYAIEASFGAPHALSGDGQTLVVGAYDHTGLVGGINAPEAGAPPPAPGDTAHWTGAIHVFVRDAQQRRWSRQAFIKAAVPVADEAFGFRVALSHDGDRALVAASTRMYLFERTAGQWRQARIFDSVPGVVLAPTAAMALSADGRSIAVSGGTWAPDGLPAPLKVTVYKQCSCSDGWRRAAELSSDKPTTSRPYTSDSFGSSLSLSSDGRTLAVGAPTDSGGAGDSGMPTNPAHADSGAVYVFAADGAGVWQRRAFLKARTAPPFDLLGSDVALSGDGRLLAAKACGFAANAQGLRRNHRAGAMIGRQEGDTSCFWGGSSYVFEESADGGWSHAAAAIPAPGELVSFEFFSLALSADAQTLGLGTTSYANAASRSSVRVY